MLDVIARSRKAEPATSKAWWRQSLTLFLLFLMLVFMAACGDDSSSVAPNDDEPSSSSVISGSDPESSSSIKSSSSSAGKVKSSSSAESSSSAKSSSSVKSSSSEKLPESSSSSADKVESSSGENSSSSATVTIASSDGSVYDGSNNTLTDLRDGQTYKTVKIGDQIWMAENLNYAYVKVPYEFEELTSDSISWCNDNDSANCVKFGRLYTWAAVMDSVGVWSESGKGCGNGVECLPVPPVRGICPNDWHLPSEDEWRLLATTVGGDSTAGKVLKSTSGWANYNGQSGNGTDAYSFSALPAGGMNNSGFYGSDDGEITTFWSSSEGVYYYASFARLEYGLDKIDIRSINKFGGYSVRCVKD